MVFHWSLRDNKSSQVSRTLLSILADLNKAVVWKVSTYPLISKSSSPFNNSSVTVPRAPITIDITVTFIFYIFFQFPSKVEALILLFAFFQFYSVTAKLTILPVLSFLLLIIVRSGHRVEIMLSVCVSKSQWNLCLSFSRADSELCIYHLFVWANLNILHSSQWITLPTQSRLVLESFCANLPHSLIMWLMASLLHITHICCFVASYLFSL